MEKGRLVVQAMVPAPGLRVQTSRKSSPKQRCILIIRISIAILRI